MSHQPGRQGLHIHQSSPPPSGNPDLPLTRWVFKVAYDGTEFHGLQWQNEEIPTIQGEFEWAARTLGSSNPAFMASGRTDAGVHAEGQIIALNIPSRVEASRLNLAVNSLLPRSVRVLESVPAPEGFCPRRSAIKRSYVYRLGTRSPINPLFRHFVAYMPQTLDEGLVEQVLALYRGKHEFKSWRSRLCQANRTVLTMTRAEASPPSSTRPYWEFHFEARSFLHNMIRYLVGGIVAVNLQKATLMEVSDALEGAPRPIGINVEPAAGLSLVKVEYPEDEDPFRR